MIPEFLRIYWGHSHAYLDLNQIRHFFEYDGTTWNDASNWKIEDNVKWDILVISLGERCKDEITKSYCHWNEKCSGSGIEPFFCITASDLLRGREK